ncbi:DUF4124 domain-containing protein [Thioalkalivibrio sulfidiphilus]|uniref:DUF4124 domain-containing protein n=1 Tax=Thioalkalivibrio sulfidiphilus TaxID=1033854 RepID=UPI003BB0E7E9
MNTSLASLALILPLALVLAMALAAPAGAQIYRWVDEQGQVHFGDCAPPRCNSTEVRMAPGPSQEQLERAREERERQREAREQRELIQRQVQEAERREQQQQERQQAQRRSYCQQARSELRILETPRPVFHVDEKGERVYLDDATRSTQIQQARQNVARFCD